MHLCHLGVLRLLLVAACSFRLMVALSQYSQCFEAGGLSSVYQWSPLMGHKKTIQHVSYDNGFVEA
jgi:hypothetical protein